jgi:hypothetical protein
MMMKQKKHLTMALALVSTIGLTASTVQAVDFTATLTVDNALTLTEVNGFNFGSLFATSTGANLVNGVGVLVIAPGATVTDPTDSATVTLLNLGVPVAAQGNVAMAANFTLTLPDTTGVLVADWAADTGSSLIKITDGTGNTVALNHSNPAVPSLYLMHFTIADVSGGVVGAETATYDGSFPVVATFGATDYVFNMGATLTTEPNGTGTAIAYQAGTYSGIIPVLAAY